MASACVNNVGISPENFPSSAAVATYGWLSPLISSGHNNSFPSPPTEPLDPPETSQDPPLDFEFRLEEDPIAMLPADELFSDGKLVPLLGTSTVADIKPSPPSPNKSEQRSRQETAGISISTTESYLLFPKAPRCTSRWKELLGLKKLSHQNSNPKTAPSYTNLNPKPIKLLPSRSSRSNISPPQDHSLTLPLLKDTFSTSDSESISISSSQVSLFSTSSGYDDLPRVSIDSDKFGHNPNPFAPRMRISKPRIGGEEESCCAGHTRGVSVDSPRMNSSGKIVFQSLERSSSSPSSFNVGGSRVFKHRGMERSYSANVRVTPVLNVPVSSLRGSSKSSSVFGFGQLFSSLPQKRESNRGSQKMHNR